MNSKVFTFNASENVTANNSGSFELSINPEEFGINATVFIKSVQWNWIIQSAALFKAIVPSNQDFFQCQLVMYHVNAAFAGIGDCPFIESWAGTVNSGFLKFYEPDLYEFPFEGIQINSKLFITGSWYNWDQVNTWTVITSLVVYCNIIPPASDLKILGSGMNRIGL